jgi:manganese-dependent inorganic pyrophosphatase
MANLTGDPTEAIQTFGRALLMAGAGLGTRAPEEIIGSDQKFYETERGSVSMSQVEVTHFDELEGRLPQLKAAMGRLVNEKSLALALLMVTDILRGNSRIIAMGDASLIADLPYAPLPDGTLDAKGVVSRKKQLVPVVLAAVKQA